MSENASSNITQILSSFDAFVKVLEDPIWFRNAKVEDIKTAFKLGNFVEKSMIHFRNQDIIKDFMNILSKWWLSKLRTQVYCDGVYSFACDELLKCCFQCDGISDSNLDVAVRIYTTLFPKERMEGVLSDLLLNAASLKEVTEFAKKTLNDSDIKCIEYNMKLQNWRKLLVTGHESTIRSEVKEMLMMYKVDTFLSLLIGILGLNVTSTSEKSVQEIVLNAVLNIMADRSILSKQFWIVLFKNVDPDTISLSCRNFNDFYIAFFNFIIYCGSMMKHVGGSWESDPNICTCPEISYRDLLLHIQSFSSRDAESKNAVIERLLQAEETTGSVIWTQIINDIGLMDL